MNEFVNNTKEFWSWLTTGFNDATDSAGSMLQGFEKASAYYTLVVRWIFPILAIAILLRCILPLIKTSKAKEVWAYLDLKDGTRMPVRHWENSIGRSKLSDIVIDFAFASRSHAVLSFCNGVWKISDLDSKGGVKVNGAVIEHRSDVKFGDVISLAGLEMTLNPPEAEPKGLQLQIEAQSPGTQPQAAEQPPIQPYTGSKISTGMTLFLILLFQILGGLQLWLSATDHREAEMPLTFLFFILIQCIYIILMRRFSRKTLELDLLCFFLCGLDLLVVAAAAPDSLYKQLIAILIGIISYTVLGVLIKDLGRARKVKYILAAGAILLLVLNLAIGETRYGAKNWINLGFVTVQPLEFVKVAFVIAGTATLDRLLTKRNMTAFIGFSGACICALVLMRDLGTAVVFFGTFIVIAFMRSGDVRTIALITSGAVLGAIAAIFFLPYIATRFATWGHAWEVVNDAGYQQTRTMIYAASGGLAGVGGGYGYLSRVAAADTDLVFGMLSEEWGMLVALVSIAIILFFAFYAVFLTKSCRSSFYAIAACGAASIFLIQTGLNVFGSMDILPLTGVTIPFVSNGGSSMIASWGLMAFIKAADDRVLSGKSENASGGKGDMK
jgi:cell division protein FtsW